MCSLQRKSEEKKHKEIGMDFIAEISTLPNDYFRRFAICFVVCCFDFPFVFFFLSLFLAWCGCFAGGLMHDRHARPVIGEQRRWREQEACGAGSLGVRRLGLGFLSVP